MTLAPRSPLPAVSALKEATGHSDPPVYFVHLASAYGHFRETGAAREALDRCRALSAQPFAAIAGAMMPDPAGLKQLLDGIALAERKTPAAN